MRRVETTVLEEAAEEVFTTSTLIEEGDKRIEYPGSFDI
jgi:hypothetical protein